MRQSIGSSLSPSLAIRALRYGSATTTWSASADSSRTSQSASGPSSITSSRGRGTSAIAAPRAGMLVATRQLRFSLPDSVTQPPSQKAQWTSNAT